MAYGAFYRGTNGVRMADRYRFVWRAVNGSALRPVGVAARPCRVDNEESIFYVQTVRTAKGEMGAE